MCLRRSELVAEVKWATDSTCPVTVFKAPLPGTLYFPVIFLPQTYQLPFLIFQVLGIYLFFLRHFSFACHCETFSENRGERLREQIVTRNSLGAVLNNFCFLDLFKISYLAGPSSCMGPEYFSGCC